MGRHQTGYIFESASGAFHVRYYTTEIVDGQPKRVQKSRQTSTCMPNSTTRLGGS